MNTPLPPRREAFVRGDLATMPDDGRRYEIVDGMLLVSAAPGRLHRRAVARLMVFLHDNLHVKRERLAQSGCPSYWVVDPCARPEEAGLVVWQLNEHKRYEQIAVVTGDEEFHATLPYPVTVVPAALVR